MYRDPVMTDEARHDREQEAQISAAAHRKADEMLQAATEVWQGKHDSDLFNYFDGPELVRFVRGALSGRLDQDTLQSFRLTQLDYIKDLAERRATR